MQPVKHSDLFAWRKQIMEESGAWAKACPMPDRLTREDLVRAYLNGVSQGMSQIINTLRLHDNLNIVHD